MRYQACGLFTLMQITKVKVAWKKCVLTLSDLEFVLSKLCPIFYGSEIDLVHITSFLLFYSLITLLCYVVTSDLYFLKGTHPFPNPFAVLCS